MRAVNPALAGVVVAIVGIWIGAEVLMGPAVIRVENRSTGELRSIEVTGNGFSERIPLLGAGESTCVRPSGMRGESGLEFRASRQNGPIEAKDLAYLEPSGGYHVRIEVLPDLKVRASDGSPWMGFCGVWR